MYTCDYSASSSENENERVTPLVLHVKMCIVGDKVEKPCNSQLDIF